MPFNFESPAEAYAAIALLVVGADGVGSSEERAFLFGEFGTARVFEGQDAEDFATLLGKLAGRMYDEAADHGTPGSVESVSEVCAGAREVLDEGECQELFSLAVDVAYSDGMHVRERAILHEILTGLGIDAEVGLAMIEEAAG